MKNTNLSTKLMMAAILLTVLFYFGINLTAYFSDPFSTTVAYTYTNNHAVTVSGYVVRQEEPLTGEDDLVYFSRGEGERVSRGGSVALIYDTQQALNDANTIRNLEDQLSQLLYARSLAAGIHSAGSLDSEVNNALAAFHAARADSNVNHVSDAAAALRSAVLRHSYAYAGTSDLDRSIAAMEEHIATLSASVSSATTTVRAPRSGLFSSLVDGYETVLTPEILETMTPEDYRAITPAAADGMGKLVYGSKWYFVTLLREADAKALSEGQSISLRFQSGLDRDLPLSVERISSAEGGQQLVVLSSNENLSLTTLLRHQNAQLIFASYTGIRVPRSAVRIVWETVKDENGQPILNEDGTEKMTQVYGVYTLWGNSARFKKVEILWQENEYMLVRSRQENDASRLLRSGDEVITAAEDLYDGKVIES